MVTDFLEINGWTTYFLGRLTPRHYIIDTINKYNIDLVCLSVTMDYHVNSVNETINKIKSSTRCNDIKIMVGGRIFNKKNYLKDINADGYAKNAHKAVKVANSLMQE